MTEPTDKRVVSQYDDAMAALAEHAGALPALCVFAAGAPLDPDGALGVIAAVEAKGIAARVLAPDAAQQRALEQSLAAAGRKARVLVADAGGVAELLRGLKASTGVALEQAVLFSPDAPALRDASRAGATAARLAAGARGPDAAALRRALGAHASKLLDSRGY
ncbi:MAG: hypothetical protein J3K34DRAFT_514090 [Monoraphidium minutum]|nr:MAG: hypothetical protein J3K34DRAFT_514090 [Monoraphidium minutum]